jgi:hypothetical protein
MKKINTNTAIAVFALSLMLGFTSFALAATTINLGSADNFAILGGSTITNTGTSVINGDLGLNPGTSVTGFPPGVLNGTQQVANATSLQAKNDLTTAFLSLASQSSATTIASELGGSTKTAGIYQSADGHLAITGTLTLDAQGDSNAIFIFHALSTLTTASGSNIILTNGAQACNVYWEVDSSATFGTNSTFKGNVLALTSITVTTGANIEGRLLARNGAVTLDTNVVTKPNCSTPPPAPVPVIVSPVSTPTPVVVPTPVVTISPVPTTPVLSESPSPAVSPSFPNTGYPPKTNISLDLIIAISVFIVFILISGLLIVTVKKQRI